MNAYSRRPLGRQPLDLGVTPAFKSSRKRSRTGNPATRSDMFHALRSGSMVLAIDGVGPFASVRPGHTGTGTGNATGNVTGNSSLLDRMDDEDSFAFRATPLDEMQRAASGMPAGFTSASRRDMTLQDGIRVLRFGTTCAVIPK